MSSRPTNLPTPLHCPICEKEFLPDEPGVSMPFCSKRCKTIDAARWLGEVYGLPYESEDQPEGETQ